MTLPSKEITPLSKEIADFRGICRTILGDLGVPENELAGLHRIFSEWAIRAEALEGGTQEIDHDLSRALGALASLFDGYIEGGCSFTSALAKRMRDMLSTQEDMARELECECERWRKRWAESRAEAERLKAPTAQRRVAQKTALLEGVRSGKIVDFSQRHRPEQTEIGRGYLGDLGDAS